jgi:hypothetical protein
MDPIMSFCTLRKVQRDLNMVKEKKQVPRDIVESSWAQEP